MSSLLLGIASKLHEQQMRVQCQDLAQRLPSAFNTSRLPLDIWLEVFPYLRDDIPTLRNVSIISLFFRNMLIPYLFRSLVFPFPSSLRRTFRLLHSTYIHPYVGSMNLTRASKRGVMKPGSSLQVIILALLKMEHLQRLAIGFACPVELYEFIRNSKQIKHLLWTGLASKAKSQGRPQCQFESLEFSDLGDIPMGLVLESTLTLKSLSVHSRHYIYSLCAINQVRPFSNLTSFTFSSEDEDIAPHVLRDILESCPAITALHFPTPLRYVFLLSAAALPKLNTLDAGPNALPLAFLEGRPVRRLFSSCMRTLALPSTRQSLQNCSFSLLHVEIEYDYAEEFFQDVNRTLVYCEDLALDVWIGWWTPSYIAVTTLLTWLTAPSLVDLSLRVRAMKGDYRWHMLDMVKLQRHFERRLRDACGGSPNLQQLKVEYCLNTWTDHGFHARKSRDGEWVVRSSFGRNTKTSWYHTETEPNETEEG